MFDSPQRRLSTEPLTGRLREAALAWLAQDPQQREVVQPRQAATVLMLRAAETGPQVFVQRRVASMAFAPGATVFPGGAVELIDAVTPQDWHAELADLMGISSQDAATVVAAAVRETHEETGVELDPKQLRPWAHWLTPDFEPRRYDTWFFVTQLKPHQVVSGTTTEALTAEWITPDAAVAAADSGLAPMLPPTYECCSELAGRFAAGESIEQVLESTRQRALPLQLPQVVERDGEIYLELA